MKTNIKKPLHFLQSRVLLTGFAAAILGMASVGYAGLRVPYAVDADTLHLWHIDGAANDRTTPDAVTSSGWPGVSPITLTNLGYPVAFPYTNSWLGSNSFPGLGECKYGNNKSNMLYGGWFQGHTNFWNPDSGAFTHELLVKFAINPLTPILEIQLICCDTNGGNATRSWVWYISNQKMGFNLLSGNSADNSFETPLPTSGPNAAVPGAWYHVALTGTGFNPTNGDTPNILKFYWTLLDGNRTNASQLGPDFTMTRRLDGRTLAGGNAPNGYTYRPPFAIGGAARNFFGPAQSTYGGMIGWIDEVRLSAVARRSDEMAFLTGGASTNPPIVLIPAPAQQQVGFGQSLSFSPIVSGSPTLSYQWQKDGGAVPGQTDLALNLSNVTFAAAGNYQLVITNNWGAVTSAVTQVTVLAVPSEWFSTGLDTNGAVTPDLADAHWILYRSGEPLNVGPNAIIYGPNWPHTPSNPNFSQTNGITEWIGAIGNQNGTYQTPASPKGLYTYRTTFLVDTADPATMQLNAFVWGNSKINDILINGKSLGYGIIGDYFAATTVAVTNGFVAGLNTLDFVCNQGRADIGGVYGFRMQAISGLGQPLPAGKPVITVEPRAQVVRDYDLTGPDGKAIFSVVALGRAPLTYQWLSGGVPISGATNRTLVFSDPASSSSPGTSFSVAVQNDSGSVTSQVATLTLVSTNQTPTPAVFRPVSFAGQTFTYWFSQLVQDASDPDHDLITFDNSGGDTWSTNCAQYFTNNLLLTTNALLVCVPVEGYVGLDEFNYTLKEHNSTPTVGSIDMLSLANPTNQLAPVGGSATFSVGLSSVPAGYAFQWQFNGANIPAASTAQWTVSNAQVADAGVYRLVVSNSLGEAYTSAVAALTVGTPGTGTGLAGDYYAYPNGTTNFTGTPALTRVDPTVDFNWGAGAPDGSLPVDNFMVRWHGQVQPFYSDTYTFSTTINDGARLWVNGQRLVNSWVNRAAAATVNGTPIALQAGQKYDLVMEYYETNGNASAQLQWSSIHQPFGIIPASQLYPGASALQPTLAAATQNRTNLVLNWMGTFSLLSAPAVTGPWTPVTTTPAGISPFTTNMNQPERYFRLQQ